MNIKDYFDPQGKVTYRVSIESFQLITVILREYQVRKFDTKAILNQSILHIQDNSWEYWERESRILKVLY